MCSFKSSHSTVGVTSPTLTLYVWEQTRQESSMATQDATLNFPWADLESLWRGRGRGRGEGEGGGGGDDSICVFNWPISL